jgi:hypothetical protein
VDLVATRPVRCQAKECAAQMLRQPAQTPRLVKLQRRLQTRTEPQDRICPTIRQFGYISAALSNKRKAAPHGGRLVLIISVTAFDDYRPVAAVPVPAAVPAAIVELGACTAIVVTITELATFAKFTAIPVAADPNTNTEVLSARYGRCRNGNRRQSGKCKT